MGSVKDLMCSRSGSEGRLYHKPGLRQLGLGAWLVSGRFSVADLKDKIPPMVITGKAQVLAMTAGRYWEQAAKAGFQSSYVGMLDSNGKIVDTEILLERGEFSNIVVMQLAHTPHMFGQKITAKSLAEYHRLIKAGRLRIYVGDCECIWRGGVPLGSTTLKRIFAAAGLSDRYEQLATYHDTVESLNEIRRIPGIMEQPTMVKVLKDMGLDRIPNPGFIMEQPIVHFNTKFDPGGDRDITDDQAQHALHISNLTFAAWKATLVANAYHQREYCRAAGVVNIDGKIEAMVVYGFPIFTDFACTVDENRLMIAVSIGSTIYLIPTNKEIQRAIFRARGIYAAKESAMHDHGDSWLHYINQYVSDAEIEDATRESVWMMEQAIGTVGNRLLGRNIFEARPIKEWFEPFLPYASIEEYAGS